MSTAREAVSEALKALSHEGAERLGSINGLFRSWQSVAAVAARAGVSESTARKWLNHLVWYRGYSRHCFAGGTYGYRYCEE